MKTKLNKKYLTRIIGAAIGCAGFISAIIQDNLLISFALIGIGIIIVFVGTEKKKK